MNKTFYIFTDYWTNNHAIFDNAEDLVYFMKDYMCKTWNDILNSPSIGDDYEIKTITVPIGINPKFSDWKICLDLDNDNDED